MVTALVVFLATAATPLEQARRIEPIGWSVDGKRVALRVFYGSNHSEVPQCTGYVDAAGKSFDTGLALVVVNPAGVEHSFVIQRPPADESCTPPAEAKRALEAAKKKFDELGIDRTKPGRVLPVKTEQRDATEATKDGVTTQSWNETWRALDEDRAVVELVLGLTSVEEEGLVEVKVRSASWTRWPVSGAPLRGKVKVPAFSYSRAMAGDFSWAFVPIASPDGTRVVSFLMDQFSNMRGGSAVTRLVTLK